jgi:regulator of cell morphogenesis and NO signaling
LSPTRAASSDQEGNKIPMTTTTTLAELAAGSLSATRILESYGLDYCCGGKRPFEVACHARGLDPAAVMNELREAQTKSSSERDWQSAPLDELARHILATHHEYLKLELPALGRRMDKVFSVHGPKDPETIGRMSAVYDALRAELELHLQKEELILFPVIEQYGRAIATGEPLPAVPFGSIANPIRMMEREHESAGDALGELRALTHDYQLPPYACSTVTALFNGLQALESDLHVHIHLENNILFPRAIALEGR